VSFNTSETNDSTSTEPSTFRFPEITLPPRNRKITTFAELAAYLDTRPSELRDAFKATYGVIENLKASNSLLEFLDKWGNCKNPLYYYLAVEFSNEVFSKLLTMLNIEANLMGCVFLASLYPCFREDHLKNFDTKISEVRISGDFVRMVTSRGAVWRRNLLERGNPLPIADGDFGIPW
jgi:hypothetical protein